MVDRYLTTVPACDQFRLLNQQVSTLLRDARIRDEFVRSTTRSSIPSSCRHTFPTTVQSARTNEPFTVGVRCRVEAMRNLKRGRCWQRRRACPAQTRARSMVRWVGEMAPGMGMRICHPVRAMSISARDSRGAPDSRISDRDPIAARRGSTPGARSISSRAGRSVHGGRRPGRGGPGSRRQWALCEDEDGRRCVTAIDSVSVEDEGSVVCPCSSVVACVEATTNFWRSRCERISLPDCRRCGC